MGTMCFLLLPIMILAFSAMARFFCFLPFISGDYSTPSTLLFAWAIFNIISIFLSMSGYDPKEETNPFLCS